MSLKYYSAPRRAQPGMPQRVTKRSAKRAVTIITRATVAKETLRRLLALIGRLSVLAFYWTLLTLTCMHVSTIS